jgi:tight adherence protein B
MNVSLLASVVSVPVILGAGFTWLNARRRERSAIRNRLQKFISLERESTDDVKSISLLKTDTSADAESASTWSLSLPGVEVLSFMLIEADLPISFASFVLLLVTLALAPLAVASFLSWNLLFALIGSIVFVAAPLIFVKAKAEARRNKFSEQLPDAIDLMVAVLRSGHSVPQAVRSVAQEIPSPCGEEFEAILQRINLGQALPESLSYATKKFHSYELDLMQRAVSIQAEVGGSLAEILDKTNLSLRQRIKLSRQLRVITAQSRLSARIVGALPVVLAIALNSFNPGYFDALLRDQIGQWLIFGAIILELMGLVLMEQMSTMRI